MHGGPRTKKQAYRIEVIKRDLGCECCHIDRMGHAALDLSEFSYRECDYHHMNLSPQHHDYGFGLCLWHHRQEGEELLVTKIPGVSSKILVVAPWVKQRREFDDRYYGEAYLLKRCNARFSTYCRTVIGGRNSREERRGHIL